MKSVKVKSLTTIFYTHRFQELWESFMKAACQKPATAPCCLLNFAASASLSSTHQHTSPDRAYWRSRPDCLHPLKTPLAQSSLARLIVQRHVCVLATVRYCLYKYLINKKELFLWNLVSIFHSALLNHYSVTKADFL